MAAGQPIELCACKMETAQQFDAVRFCVRHRLLSLVDFKKRECCPAMRKAALHQNRGALGTRQDLLVDFSNLGSNSRAFGRKPVKIAPMLYPRDCNLSVGCLSFCLGSLDVATISRTAAKRDRAANHDRHIVALAEVAHTHSYRGIAEIARFSEAHVCGGLVSLGGQQR